MTKMRNPNDIMIQESSEVLGGNDQFEGFVPDMVNILSRILHFNYTLRIGSTVRQINFVIVCNK